MDTKLLMTASSVFMGAVGITLSFASSEVLNAIGQEPNFAIVIISQLTGALYFGFAMLNWMAKAVLIGGIYARPVCIGNFCHFAIAGLALLKTTFSQESISVFYILLTTIYLLFALLFGYVFFTGPTKKISS